MTLTDSERDEFVEMLTRVFTKMDTTPELLQLYGNVLQTAVSAQLAYEAIELYIDENDSPFPTPAGLKERVVRVNARYTTEHARDPLSIDAVLRLEARRQIHDAKLNRIQAKASPASDPVWDDDTPPWKETIDLADWVAQQPADPHPCAGCGKMLSGAAESLAHTSPLLAAKLGIKIGSNDASPADEKQAAVARAQAMKRGGWS